MGAPEGPSAGPSGEASAAAATRACAAAAAATPATAAAAATATAAATAAAAAGLSLHLSLDGVRRRVMVFARQQHLRCSGDLTHLTVHVKQQWQQQQQQQQQQQGGGEQDTGGPVRVLQHLLQQAQQLQEDAQQQQPLAAATAAAAAAWELDLSRNFLEEFDWTVAAEALGRLGLMRSTKPGAPPGGPSQGGPPEENPTALEAGALCCLCLTANELRGFPAFLGGPSLQQLRELRLNYNKIESLSSSCCSSSSGGCGEFAQLSLGCNRISDLSAYELPLLPSLTSLSLFDNKINCLNPRRPPTGAPEGGGAPATVEGGPLTGGPPDEALDGFLQALKDKLPELEVQTPNPKPATVNLSP
ncbi:hypothetical protein Esti_000020 [Eimeria stiedai]